MKRMFLRVADFLLYCDCGAQVYSRINGASVKDWIGQKEVTDVKCEKCQVTVRVRVTVLRRVGVVPDTQSKSGGLEECAITRTKS